MAMKQKISLRATFWRFLWWLAGGIVGAVLLSYGMMTLSIGCGFATYSNHSEVQVKEMAPILAATPELSEIRLPVGVDYVLLDKTYQLLGTSLQGEEQEQAIAYAITGAVDGTARKRYLLVTRETEYVVLQYYIGSRFTNEWMNEHLPPPDVLVIALAGLNCIAISVFLTARFAKRLRRQLEPLFEATAEIAEQNLDFEMGHVNIKEFDEVLSSFSDMKESLKTSLEQQWKAEQMQREQIAALAHDIKTPLTIIQGNAELLHATELDKEQRLYSEYIAEGAEQMQAYVKALLDMARTAAGYRLCAKEIRLSDFLKQIEVQAKALCNGKNIRFRMEREKLPERMSADKRLLERAILNVISNAVEYSPQDSTVVMDIRGETNVLQFSLTDEGYGFSPEGLLHAKEQFYMSDQSRGRKMHYGMGLYITKNIVEQHKGALLLDNSEETGGARVTIRIPLS